MRINTSEYLSLQISDRVHTLYMHTIILTNICLSIHIYTD